MTTTEFKIKYPKYSALEGDELWDKMTETLLHSNNCLYADPNRDIIYHDPIAIDGMSIQIEDSSTTRWLNSEGEEVIVPSNDSPTEPSHTSYRMHIIDFSKL